MNDKDTEPVRFVLSFVRMSGKDRIILRARCAQHQPAISDNRQALEPLASLVISHLFNLILFHPIPPIVSFILVIH